MEEVIQLVFVAEKTNLNFCVWTTSMVEETNTGKKLTLPGQSYIGGCERTTFPPSFASSVIVVTFRMVHSGSVPIERKLEN